MQKTHVRLLCSSVLALTAVTAAAQERSGTVRVTVTPDRADWTYSLGAPASFRVAVTRDGHSIPGASVSYSLGLEKMKPTEEKTAAVPADGLVVKAKGLSEPGFLRLIATAKVEGQEYRGLATAGYAPDQIKPTRSRSRRLRRVLGGRRRSCSRRCRSTRS